MLQCGPDHMHHYCICQPVLLYDWRWVRRGGGNIFICCRKLTTVSSASTKTSYLSLTNRKGLDSDQWESFPWGQEKKDLQEAFFLFLSLSLSLSLWHSAEIWRLGCFYWSSRTKRRARKRERESQTNRSQVFVSRMTITSACADDQLVCLSVSS